jgi:hypothetical protein
MVRQLSEVKTALVNFQTSSSNTKMVQRKMLEEATLMGYELGLFNRCIEKPEGSFLIFRIRKWVFTHHQSKAIGYGY